jgi:hypothetical protein
MQSIGLQSLRNSSVLEKSSVPKLHSDLVDINNLTHLFNVTIPFVPIGLRSQPGEEKSVISLAHKSHVDSVDADNFTWFSQEAVNQYSGGRGACAAENVTIPNVPIGLRSRPREEKSVIIPLQKLNSDPLRADSLKLGGRGAQAAVKVTIPSVPIGLRSRPGEDKRVNIPVQKSHADSVDANQLRHKPQKEVNPYIGGRGSRVRSAGTVPVGLRENSLTWWPASRTSASRYQEQQNEASQREPALFEVADSFKVNSRSSSKLSTASTAEPTDPFKVNNVSRSSSKLSTASTAEPTDLFETNSQASQEESVVSDAEPTD